MITIFLSRLFLPPTKCREYRTTKLTKEVLREKSVCGGGTTSKCKNAREIKKRKKKGNKNKNKNVSEVGFEPTPTFVDQNALF